MARFQYVYFLVSEHDPRRHYTGMTTNLRARLSVHNSGNNKHTAKHRPWRSETVIAFRSREKALAFELWLAKTNARARFGGSAWLGQRIDRGAAE